ncbi:MAG: hypothetical protein HYV60_18190 [Planctomycetia bacterium]|nr:hypothetical protein [Planctomycetia bacterium]
MIAPEGVPLATLAEENGLQLEDGVAAGLAPRMPLPQRRLLTTVLQALSTGPEPMCQPAAI